MEIRQQVDVGLAQPWTVITATDHIRIIDEADKAVCRLSHDDVPLHLAKALAQQRHASPTISKTTP